MKCQWCDQPIEANENFASMGDDFFHDSPGPERSCYREMGDWLLNDQQNMDELQARRDAEAAATEAHEVHFGQHWPTPQPV